MNDQILLVEDDISVPESSRLLLERAGLAVTSVADGLRAVEAFSEGPYDLVLLDLMLPGLDGIEVSRRSGSTDRPRASGGRGGRTPPSPRTRRTSRP